MTTTAPGGKELGRGNQWPNSEAAPDGEKEKAEEEAEVEEEEDAGDEDDDDEQIFSGSAQSGGGHSQAFTLAPRWPTRILALACLRRLMYLCHQAADSAPTLMTEIGLRSPHPSRDLLPRLNNPHHHHHLGAHFDLAMARKLRRSLTDAPWLVLHLGDLVRVTFIAATASSDHLRRFGLFALKQVIQLFAPVVDPDSAG